MAAPTFVANTEGVVALAAGVAKTVLNVIAPASKALHAVPELGISFDGITASAAPVLVELMRSTQATAGTSTAVTLRLARGPAATANATAGKNYTVEPTVLTPVREWLVDPYKGLLIMQFPLGREPEPPLGGGLLLRCNAPAAVNARAYIEFEE